jgi:hypothetical protein
MKLSDLRAELKGPAAPARHCTFCMWEGRMMKATHVVRDEYGTECFTCGHSDHFNALHTYIPIVKWFQDAGVIIMDGETHYTDAAREHAAAAARENIAKNFGDVFAGLGDEDKVL